MSVRIVCGQCKKTYFAADKLAGKRIKCMQCGAALEVPMPAAEAEPAAESRSAVTAEASYSPDAASPEDFAGDYAVTDFSSSSSSSAAAAFPEDLSSRMREELGSIFTEGGPLRFAASHKLMLAVVMLAVMVFVVCIASHRCNLAALALLAGAGIAVTAFVPESGNLELRLARVIFYGGCAVSLLTAIYLFLVHYRGLPDDSSWHLPLLAVEVIAVALAGLGLSFWVCNLFPRFGMFQVLGWGYLCVAGLIPLSLSTLLSVPGVNTGVQAVYDQVCWFLDPPSAKPPPPLNNGPRITSAAPLEASVGEEYVYSVAATDPEGDTLQFVLTTSPKGMRIEAQDGRITWTPTAAQVGPQAVTIEVSNSRGDTTEQSFEVEVLAAGTKRQGGGTPPIPPGPGPDVERPPPSQWDVASETAAQPPRPLGGEPLDLGIGAQDIVRIMFSGPQAARAVVLSRQSEVAPTRSSASSLVAPHMRMPGEEESAEQAATSAADEEPQPPPDEDEIAARTASGQITYWIDVYDLLTGRRLRRMRMPPTSQLADVSPDGKEAIIVTPERLDVWSLDKRGVEHGGWPLSDQKITKIPWASFLGESHLATLDDARRLVVWSLPDFKEVYHLDEVALAAVSPGGKYLLTFAAAGDSTLEGCLREAASEEVRGSLQAPTSVPAASFSFCAFRGDGEQVALGGGNGLVVWNMKDGTVLCEDSQAKVTKCLAFFNAQEDFLLLDKDKPLDKGRFGLFRRHDPAFVWTYYTSAATLDPWEIVVGSPDGRLWTIVPHVSLPATYLLPLDAPNDQRRKELLRIRAGEIPTRGDLHSEISIKMPEDEKAYEQACREYVQRVMFDLIIGDEAILQNNLWWFPAPPPATPRPCIGLRWGLAVEKTKQPELIPPDDLKKFPGPMAIMAGLQERINKGAFGRWPRLGDTRFREVALLGGPQKELLPTARRQALDVLVVATLTQTPRVIKGVPVEETKVRIVDVADGKPLWTSKPIRTSDLAPGPAAGLLGSGSRESTPLAGPIRSGPHGSTAPSGPIKRRSPGPAPAAAADPGAEFVAEILKQIDNTCSLSPMRTRSILPEKAKQRVTYLLTKRSTVEDDWRLLLESRYYQSRQLLTADEAIPFYDAIVGAGKGQALAIGDERQRYQLLQEWLGRNSPLQTLPKKHTGSAVPPISAPANP